MHIRILVLYITVMVSGIFFFVYGALKLPPPDNMYTFKKSEAGEELIKEISTEEAINANTSSLEPTLIFFYSVTCPHCKEMRPIYEKLAKSMLQNKTFHFDAVSCSEKPKVCSYYGVKWFPEVIFFWKGYQRKISQTKYDAFRLPKFWNETLNLAKASLNITT